MLASVSSTIITLTAALTILVVQSTQAGDQGTQLNGDTDNAPFARLDVKGFNGSRTARPSRQGFSATSTLDLVFEVTILHKITGSHLLELELYTPNGHLYQVLTIPVAVDETKPKRSVVVKGFPKPVEQQSIDTSAKQGEKRSFVTARLPVAGTYISTNSLLGWWRVEAVFDGERVRLIGDRAYLITP